MIIPLFALKLIFFHSPILKIYSNSGNKKRKGHLGIVLDIISLLLIQPADELLKFESQILQVNKQHLGQCFLALLLKWLFV
jgi:hypothetical protein